MAIEKSDVDGAWNALIGPNRGRRLGRSDAAMPINQKTGYRAPARRGLGTCGGVVSSAGVQRGENLVASGHSVSQSVTTGSLPHHSETLENTGVKSLPVTMGHELSKPGGWCALQGLNLRPLPCEGNALPLS